MPVNRNALIRYKTLDKCLQNRYRQWTLEDLIDAVSDALYDYEGIDKGVSRRTVQGDIQIMRSDKLGYNAPIVVVDRKYYTYEDPDYSITNLPISDQDLGHLSEAVEFLKQFKGFSHFRQLDSMVQKLEDHVYSQQTQQSPVIDFEKNEHLKGLHHLDRLYQAIIQKKALKLTYQSFKARQAQTFNYHAYLLKEFRNRWFVIGARKSEEQLVSLALDRIIAIEDSEVSFRHRPDFDPEAYFRDAIGVSVSPNLSPENVELFVYYPHAPYVLTKPLHHSQEVIERNHFGVRILLKVQHNFELEKDILGMGDSVRVLAPERLRRTIRERLQAGVDIYRTELSDHGIEVADQQLTHRGTAVLPEVYTQRELRKMSKWINQYFNDHQLKDVIAIRELLIKIPKLRSLIFNQNFLKIAQHVLPGAQVVKAMYFDKPATQNWYVTWHQDRTINVKKKVKADGYSGWAERDGVISVNPPEAISQDLFAIRIHLDDTDETNGALEVLAGSHKKRLTDEEIQLITNNSMPGTVVVPAGGIHLMKPLLLHASGKTESRKRRRVIHLELGAMTPDHGLEWAEAQSLVG